MKKLLLILSIVTIMLGLCACGDTTPKAIDAEAKKAIEEGLKKLQDYKDIYLVANVMEAPDGVINYIEITSDGDNYTEYPLDADGNIGTIEFGASADTQYLLYDWLTNDNKYYSVTSDTNNDILYYILPDDLGKSIADRKTMFMSYMIDKFTSIKPYDETSVNIGNGEEDLVIYKCELPAKYAQHILGFGSYNMYESVKNSTQDENIKKLCGYYCEELGRSLTCSDASVLVGIDKDGLLKYVSIEVGGIGTNLYYTKCLITNDNIESRNKPDFASAINFEEMLKEQADFVAQYDSYDEAIKAMNNSEENNEDYDEPTTDEEVSLEEVITEEVTTEEVTSEEVTSEETSSEEATSEEATEEPTSEAREG